LKSILIQSYLLEFSAIVRHESIQYSELKVYLNLHLSKTWILFNVKNKKNYAKMQILLLWTNNTRV